MSRFKWPVVVVALVASLSALALFLARSDLADTRATLADTRAARDNAWDNYLLSEQRGTAAVILVAARDPLGIAEAVVHMRGAFTAISVAADQAVPESAFRLLGGDGQPHLSPLASELAAGQHDAYRALKEQIAPLQGEALSRVAAYRTTTSELEGRAGRLTNRETAMFLLTVLCALLLNLFGAKKDEPGGRRSEGEDSARSDSAAISRASHERAGDQGRGPSNEATPPGSAG